MRDFVVISLLVIVVCLVSVLMGMRIGHNSALEGSVLSSFTSEQVRECLECDAPMWSDAWCESCYALWSVVK